MSRLVSDILGRSGSIVVGLLMVFAMQAFIPANMFILSLSIVGFGFVVGILTNKWYTEILAGVGGAILVYVWGSQYKLATGGNMAVTFALIFGAAWVGEFIDQLAGKLIEKAAHRQWDSWLLSDGFMSWMEERGYHVTYVAPPEAPASEELIEDAPAPAAALVAPPPPAGVKSVVAVSADKVDYSDCPDKMPEQLKTILAEIMDHSMLEAMTWTFDNTFQKVRQSGAFKPKKAFATASSALNDSLDAYVGTQSVPRDPDQLMGLAPFFAALGWSEITLGGVEAFVKAQVAKKHFNGSSKKAIIAAFKLASDTNENWPSVTAPKA